MDDLRAILESREQFDPRADFTVDASGRTIEARPMELPAPDIAGAVPA